MASDALISRGWVWLDTWMVEKTNETDDEGWSYAVNFGTIETNAVATKGMTHFVRRRRFIRRQSYVGSLKLTFISCESLHDLQQSIA